MSLRAACAFLALGAVAAGCEKVAGLRTRTQIAADAGGGEGGESPTGGSGGQAPGGTGGSGGGSAGGTGGRAGSQAGGTGGGGGVGGSTGGTMTGTGGAMTGTGGMATGGADGGVPAASCPPHGRLATCDPKYLDDASNCCVAGRSCQGGACVGGKCQPIVIAAEIQSDLQDVQVAGDYLVVAGGCEKRARRYTKLGGGELLLPLDADGKCVPRLGVWGDQVYWVEWDGPYLGAAPLDASAAARRVAKVPVALTDVTLRQMAVDGQRAYWVTSDPSGVWSAPLNGTGGPATAVAAQQSTGLAMETTVDAFGVAVDGAHLYWSDPGQHNIRRRALSTLGMNLAAEPIATGGAPQNLAVDAERVYWVTADGFVFSHGKAPGGAATMLAANQTDARSILVDDHYVYWVRNVARGTVSRVAKTGTPSQVENLATDQKVPLGLAQDCGTIYWTNQNDYKPGEIVKVAK